MEYKMRWLKELSHHQATLIFVITGLKKRYGRTFVQGRLHEPLSPVHYSNPPNTETLWDPQVLTFWQSEFPDFKNQNPFEFINTYRLKGLRQNAQLALIAYVRQVWPLLPRWDSPSPEELLQIQANGQRVVSLLPEFDFSAKITIDKDNLEFTIHDLEHAAKYFSDKELQKSQQSQFQKFTDLAKEQELQSLIVNDPLYKKDWHYLISDMNTAPAHSWFFFRGTLLNAFKRQAQIDLKEKLPEESEKRFSLFSQRALKSYFPEVYQNLKNSDSSSLITE